MKKRGFLLTAAAMLITLAMATITQADSKTYYAAKEKVNAYEEKTSSSEKLKEYNGGDKIQVEKSEDGWYGVSVPDPDGSGRQGLPLPSVPSCCGWHRSRCHTCH